MQYIDLIFILGVLNRELFIERVGARGPVTPSPGEVLGDRLCHHRWPPALCLAESFLSLSSHPSPLYLSVTQL